MQPTIGRIVHYTLSEGDAMVIKQNRQERVAAASGIASASRFGNDVEAGQVYPAQIVRVFSPSSANLQVFLDGSDQYWATSRSEGSNPGTWSWPPRV